MTTNIIIDFATIRENADTTLLGEIYGNVDITAERRYTVNGDFAAGCERALKLVSAYKNPRGAVRVTVSEIDKPMPAFCCWAIRPTAQAVVEINDWLRELAILGMPKPTFDASDCYLDEPAGCECEIDWDCGCGSQRRYASARDF